MDMRSSTRTGTTASDRTMTASLDDILARALERPRNLSVADLTRLVSLEAPEERRIVRAAAYGLKCRIVGKLVSMRGIVEIGNVDPVGSREAIGSRGEYYFMCNNCHQFTRYCVTGVDDESSTPWTVDDIVEALKKKFVEDEICWRSATDSLQYYK